MTENETKNYYSLEEVRMCVYSGIVSRTTMHKLAATKQIPVVKVCARLLVPAWWVDNQIKMAHTVPEPEVANG